jgi:hypothetical protein
MEALFQFIPHHTSPLCHIDTPLSLNLVLLKHLFTKVDVLRLRLLGLLTRVDIFLPFVVLRLALSFVLISQCII